MMITVEILVTANGYSGHSEKEVMMNKLQKMMNESNDQHEREIIQNYMHKL